MYLVELLFPLSDRASADHLQTLLTLLADEFGGVTAFSQAPADGRWTAPGRVEQDDIVLVEVMTEDLDRDWWGALRLSLEQRLGQDELVIRASRMERL